MARNLFSPYGRLSTSSPAGSRMYIVSPSGTSQYADIGQMYPVNEDGVPIVYTTVAAVFAQANAIAAGRGDTIYLTNDYTTALTATDLLNAETNGVTIIRQDEFSNNIFTGFRTYRATAALPASATGSIFTVTGRIKLLDIIGTVTTVIQTQACNLKITNTPTAAGLTATDICANLNVSANAVNSFYTITGTLANALVNNTAAAAVYQATPVILNAGTLDLITSATNTGSVKWSCLWVPLDPGARMIAL
jgi:hypothetical protein